MKKMRRKSPEFFWANLGCLGKNGPCFFPPISTELREIFHVLKNHISGAGETLPVPFRAVQQKNKKNASRDTFPGFFCVEAGWRQF